MLETHMGTGKDRGTARQAFADYLRASRDNTGVTGKQVAKALGVDPAQVSRWERAAQLPDPRRLRDIAEVLQVDPLDLAMRHAAAGMEDSSELRRDRDRLRSEAAVIMRRLDDVDAQLAQVVGLLEQLAGQRNGTSGPGLKQR